MRSFELLLVASGSAWGVAASSAETDSAQYRDLGKILNDSAEVDSAAEVFRIQVSVLRPTQFGLGMAEVRFRQKKIEKMSEKELGEYLKKKVAKVVVGPGRRPYLVDGHHLARALYESSRKGSRSEILTRVTLDRSELSQDEFMEFLGREGLAWPYDENGYGPLPLVQLPLRLWMMPDDAYRGLAWAVENAGGFLETEQLFAEFLWARFFRKHFSQNEAERLEKKTVRRAVELAHSDDPEAQSLPGYFPPRPKQLFPAPLTLSGH